jgi:uncharacterized protein YkwD
MRKAALIVATLVLAIAGAPPASSQVGGPPPPPGPPKPPPPPSPTPDPQILSVQVQQPNAAGGEANVRVRAVDKTAPVSGIAMTFKDGDSFGLSACRAPDWRGRLGPPFTPGSRVEFTVPHSFLTGQEPSLVMQIDASDCSAGLRSVFRPFIVPTQTPPRSAAALTSADTRALARGTRCPGARSVVGGSSMRSARRALLCVLNTERRARGLRGLRANRRLLHAAIVHSHSMVVGAFFSHVGIGGLSFVQRIRRAGYLRGAHRWVVGENIGYGRGRAASPLGMVRSWMGSTPHRANILAGQFREIGLGIEPGVPGRPGTGTTYTTDFGGRR